MERKTTQTNEDLIRKGERDKIIIALVKMRIDKFATTKTMLEFLINQLKYKESYAYELMREAKKKIIEIFKEEHEESFETYRARLEELVETSSNEKVKLEAIKELNKLLGLHRPQKIDVTTNGKDITDINVNIIYKSDNETEH